MSLTITRANFKTGFDLQGSNSVSGVSFAWNREDTAFKSGGSYVFDRIFSAQDVTLLDTNNEDINVEDLGSYDLGNGPGRDSIGLGHTNVSIKYIRIRNRESSTGDLTVDGNQTNGWGELVETTHVLKPGEEIVGSWPTSGKAVSGTSNIIRLSASSGDLAYDFIFLSSQS